MTSTLKRQLSDSDKEHILSIHGHSCYATNHHIPEQEPIDFDHIRAYATGGLTELNNIAPMCRQHNRAKGTLSLYDFRARLRLNDFFNLGDRLTLHDLLSYMKEKEDIPNYGQSVSIEENLNEVKLESWIKTERYETHICPVTGWKYFYAPLAVDLLDSDDDHDQSIGLQPRYLISNKVFELFRHFQEHPVLQPSLGRIVDGRIRLFDGQHKAAALLWNSYREIDCKIYLESDIRLLNQTNISAHEKFAQTRFFSSIMVMKLGSQFQGDFETYRDEEDGKAQE